jgi:hypothetical protein
MMCNGVMANKIIVQKNYAKLSGFLSNPPTTMPVSSYIWPAQHPHITLKDVFMIVLLRFLSKAKLYFL